MENKDYEGFTTEEVVKNIEKKKKRYCAIGLGDMEEDIDDPEVFKKVRKSFLDSMNNYTRSIFKVIGITIEGLEDY